MKIRIVKPVQPKATRPYFRMTRRGVGIEVRVLGRWQSLQKSDVSLVRLFADVLERTLESGA